MKLGPNQKAFLKALRTTTKTQGQKRLCAMGFDGHPCEYCALGVAGSEIFNMSDFELGLGTAYQTITFGLNLQDPARVYTLNDANNLSFSEIADEIEANPSYYFQGTK